MLKQRDDSGPHIVYKLSTTVDKTVDNLGRKIMQMANVPRRPMNHGLRIDVVIMGSKDRRADCRSTAPRDGD